MKLLVISGIPGSGKTTLATKLSERYNAYICSYENLTNANTVESTYGNVQQLWIQEIRAALQSGKSVICDRLNLTTADRNELLASVADIPCEKVLYMQIVPLEICLQRNRERLARLPDFVVEQAAQKLEVPTDSEGWDEICLNHE